ncbi:MAG: hypothetical protein P4L64_10210 [Caulobacteraceae bacterium]|nr:hypothetical protein [Caulobacteraceae bacterium]
MSIADAPAWLSGLIMILAFPLAVEAGFRLHKRTRRATDQGDDAGGVGHVISAALALLGLLIGFTFMMAAERYETRRQLVIQEANAISTTYLRAQMFDEPARTRLTDLVADYARQRLAFAAAGMDDARLDAVDTRTAALQTRLWGEIRTALATPQGAPLTTSMLQAANDMFDLAATRRAALDARVPEGVFRMLAIFALATAAIMGYGLCAGGRRHGLLSSGLFVLVALTIALIIDLDQPRSGSIRVSQVPLERTVAPMLPRR